MSVKTINNVYVVGLGALGGMYASKLQDLNPGIVKIIADLPRIEKYRNSGFNVNGTARAFEYISPGDQVPFADLIVITVKFHALSQAIQDIKPFVGPGTLVISLLNGIGSEELIAAEIGSEHLLHAYAVGMDAMREGTTLSYSKIGRIVFGDKENGNTSAKVLALKDLFERSGIPFLAPDNIERALWTKFMMNVGINQASTILKASYGEFQHHTPARELMIMAAREVLNLSQFYGVNLKEEDITDFIKIIETLSADGKTSMLQDIEAERKTEVEIFAGAVIAMGKLHQIPTPVNETFYQIIKFMELSAG
ncbi:ketopantoate reductase [Pedobacter westerhofensis]|uniref:2-dehydropantoate 2-reductase n=1 Tax=Pedobacter westerhofensis TaxID=425512 RepID=A0A521E808_9SPHI|nr:ketopantoate reductase family protein [Pedobacter westerhofensis]SMO79300.1 ketopantoate reductase [Pedobacter westerhofensis]